MDNKKIKDLRASGLSLREIAEKLKITRNQVEEALASKVEAPKPTSEKKAAKKKATPTKGK